MIKKAQEMNALASSACEKGDADSLARALSQGADPNGTNVEGFTLAMLASHCGHIDCLALIIKSGAKLSIKAHSHSP